MRRLCCGGARRGFVPLGRGREGGAQIDLSLSRPGEVNHAGKAAAVECPGQSRLKVKLRYRQRRAKVAGHE